MGIRVMAVFKHITHPNFLTGLASYLLLLVGIFLRYGNLSLGRTVIGTAVVLGGIHWVASIADVLTNANLKKYPESRYLWLALIVMIPPVCGMLYYLMNKRNVTF